MLAEDGLAVREWDVPEPGPGEARVALRKVGICGSDVHFVIDGLAKTSFLPIVLGHEPAGVVDALGPDTEGPEPGTRVAIVPLVTCGVCDRCRAGRSVTCREQACLGAGRHGCWADYATVPVRNLVPLPDAMSDEMGAVATDSVATAYHAVATRGGVSPGARVAIWGVGGLGLSAVGIARALGAATVIAVDPREAARGWALETGATEALAPEGARQEIAGRGGVDVALEFVGTTLTCESAVRCLDNGGRAVVVGLGDGQASAGRLITFVPRERELVSSYGAEPEEVVKVIEMLTAGDLVLPRAVSDVIPLDEIQEGLERVHRGETNGSRVVVDITA